MATNLGEKISMLRKEAGFTQQDMANKIGINRSSLVKIENSQRAISLEEGEAISEALGISLDSLLADNNIVEESFAKAFKAKGMNDSSLSEITKFELLFDALITQEQIYGG